MIIIQMCWVTLNILLKLISPGSLTFLNEVMRSFKFAHVSYISSLF